MVSYARQGAAQGCPYLEIVKYKTEKEKIEELQKLELALEELIAYIQCAPEIPVPAGIFEEYLNKVKRLISVGFSQHELNELSRALGLPDDERQDDGGLLSIKMKGMDAKWKLPDDNILWTTEFEALYNRVRIVAKPLRYIGES